MAALAQLTILLLPLLLTVARCDAACGGDIKARDVNESSSAGVVIESLDATYQTSAPLTVDSVYACYFEIASSALRLKKQFNLENFTSCADGSIVPAGSITSALPVNTQCTSGGSGTFLIRLVDINEFPPTFAPTQFRLSVSEAAPVGTIVIQLNSYVTDGDKSNQRTFNLAIVNGSQGDFSMNDGITSGIVRIQRTLDYDAGHRQYVMNVSAADLSTEASSLPVPLTGYATLIVDVTDADDKSPHFLQSSYTLSFMENDTNFINKPLATIPPLEALDGDTGINQTVNYAIESVMWSGSPGSRMDNATFLSINKSTALFTVTSIIDREALPSNTLLVQVKAYQTDKPDTRISIGLVVVTVGDKNDNAPVMSAATYNVSIAENSLAGSYVTTIRATDVDLGANATFVFRLNDTLGAFQVDPTSGQVTVASAALLDREARHNFTMLVWAHESATPESFASPASQLVVNLLDVNDNSPTFGLASYAFSVSGNAAVGTSVGNVSAADSDLGPNGQVRYAVSWATPTSAGALFQLDAASGTLATAASLTALATSSGTVVLLQVAAEDQASPAAARRQSTVVVEITVSPSSATPAGNDSASTAATDTTASISSISSSNTGTTIAPTNSTSSTGQPTTPQPSNGTTTAPPSILTASLASIHIALIVICAVLLLAVLALVAVVTWCWKTRQPRPLKALSVATADLVSNGKANPLFAVTGQQQQTSRQQARPQQQQPQRTNNGSQEPPISASERASVNRIESRADSHSPSGLTLSRIMFEPAPYQSLSFAMAVPNDNEEEATQTSTTDNGVPVLRTAV